MRTTPRFLMLLLAVLALVAAACGDDDDDAASETTESTTTTTTAETSSTGAEETTTTEASSTTSDEESTTTTTADSGDGTIVEVLIASGDFPTLVAALEATGLDVVLSGTGPFTLLAPTEEAFAGALDSLGLTEEELLVDARLEDILTYHVLPIEAPASTVITLDGEEVDTVNGATVLITIDGESVMVNDAAVIEADIEASNGVIHVIDAVLIPPSG